MNNHVKEKTDKQIMPLQVNERYYREEEAKIISSKKWTGFLASIMELQHVSLDRGLILDPRCNSIHWAFDVHKLCREIAFSYCWMKAYVKFYKEMVDRDSQPSHVDFHVSYFADNSITRIDACRDKLALMSWAFYCPFNPEKQEEILEYRSIIKRLSCPIKFGLQLKNQKDFLDYLIMLNSPEFTNIEKYRHLKIHRREPRVEIYGVKPFHDWPYMIPIIEKKDIERFEKELINQYPDPQLREQVKKRCYIDNMLFTYEKLQRVLDYKKIEKYIKICLKKLIIVSAGCNRVLINKLQN